MDYAVCWHCIVPIDYFRDIFPICNSACICDVFELAAIKERPLADRSYAVTDCYTRKSAAIKERRITDRSYAVGDSYVN